MCIKFNINFLINPSRLENSPMGLRRWYLGRVCEDGFLAGFTRARACTTFAWPAAGGRPAGCVEWYWTPPGGGKANSTAGAGGSLNNRLCIKIVIKYKLIWYFVNKMFKKHMFDTRINLCNFRWQKPAGGNFHTESRMGCRWPNRPIVGFGFYCPEFGLYCLECGIYIVDIGLLIVDITRL